MSARGRSRCLYRWSIVLLLSLTGRLGITHAQAPALPFTHITDEQGLSNTSVEVIFQDSRGFVWVGTRHGLNRYDIRTYFHDSTDAHSLSDNYIKCIFEDHQHALWIGTSGGLNRYDPAQNRFVRYQHQPGKTGSLNHNDINQIFEDERHALWVSTMGGGLYQFNPQNETVSRWRFLLERMPDGRKLVVYDLVRIGAVIFGWQPATDCTSSIRRPER
jgi:ligand-binding sensor domain-containing protein